MREDYCRCEKVESVSSDTDDFGYWDICNRCRKPIEDSYEYFNSCEGEDY